MLKQFRDVPDLLAKRASLRGARGFKAVNPLL